MLSFLSETSVLCRDHVGSEYSKGKAFYRQTFNTSGAAEDSAADVVLVVDESGSIDMKVLWIREVSETDTDTCSGW